MHSLKSKINSIFKEMPSLHFYISIFIFKVIDVTKKKPTNFPVYSL